MDIMVRRERLQEAEVMSSDDVRRCLLHEGNKVYIDNVISFDEKKLTLTATKTLTEADVPLFEGHYPNDPVLQVAVVIEMCFQAAILMFCLINKEAKPRIYAGPGRFKTRKPIRPGDRLIIVIQGHAIRERLISGSAKVFNEHGDLMMEMAEMSGKKMK